MKRARGVTALVLLLALAGARAAAQTAPAPPTETPPATAPAADTSVRTLDELLERVRAGRLRDTATDAERAREFGAAKEDQQAALEAARKELAAALKRAAALEKQWETNQQQLAEQQAALRTRLGSLAQLFAELGAAGPVLRARLQYSPASAQLGQERLSLIDRLLDTAASGTRLPPIADLDALWFELQRELTESARVRRFETEIDAADGTRARASVVRAGNFALFGADGTYLLYDAPGGTLATPGRRPAGAITEEAATLFAATSGWHPLTLDPTLPRDAAALRTALAKPTLAERVRASGTLGWLVMLLAAGACLFALYRLLVLRHLRARIGAASAAAPLHPLGSLRALALTQVQLDAGALEHALHEAVLHELPALERGLAPLRTIGSALPLLGVLGTVLALAASAEPAAATVAGTQLFTADLAQALVMTVQGVLGGLAVLLLQAVLAARTRDFVLLLEEEAAALVTARAMAAI